MAHVKNWNYRELRDRIDDGFSLRKFTEFYAQPVPEYHAFNHALSRLTPRTLKVINDLVVMIAVDIGLEDGTKLRGDTTVVQTDIRRWY